MPDLDKSVNKKVVSTNDKTIGSWNEAIRANELLLLRIQVRQREVAAIIRLFKEKKEAGEPWPGSKKAGTAAESVPA